MTHEQTDFDGFASMLGAYLLEDRAYPILPNNMNRNVQQFYHNYRFELPFILPQALPKQNIHSITLVDTQSMVTLKGITRDTRVCVFDHHKKKDDFSSDWAYNDIKTGACTTYFVEHLIEHNGNLSMVQATLLLLGIYEDTGSLTYASTTARDAQAVAYLLSQGASLKIAADYLNPSLSPGQQKVLEALIQNQQVMELKKKRVMVSHADAEFLEEEVSSIAHKLCDLYDPDGLFLFVKTKEGIRFVARSVCDEIDVSNIAERFGGGGHTRAAAALIRKSEGNRKALQELEKDFIASLDDFINPSISVKQIMSTNPLLLEPSTKLQEALQLMQRFGYEGFPVVQENQVIGLLTRRAVDRALSHKMDVPVKSLMEAGNYFVHPETSLEELHQIMAKSNWGQIPVVNKQDKKIIGIVTRTDLLQAYSGIQSPENGKMDLSSLLENTLKPNQMKLIKMIAETAHEMRMHVYLVGGVVRDIILKSPILDLDFVVEGNAIELAHQLIALYGGKITSHRQFGTAKWFLEDSRIIVSDNDANSSSGLPKSIDLISARTEFYKNPSALPTVKLSSIKLDLLRRDFTINTLAIRLDGKHYGKLYDYWGGLDDLNDGIIRVLHSLSFVDDPTRMLRAIRFEQRFGFQIEKRTLELFEEAKPLLKQVSGDRIRHEMDLIFRERLAVDILNRLQQLELLQAIDPDLHFSKKNAITLQAAIENKAGDGWALPSKVGNSSTEIVILYTIFLCMQAEKSVQRINKRLKLPKVIQKSISQARELIEKMPQLIDQKPSEIYYALKNVPNHTLFAVQFFFHDNHKVQQNINLYLSEWTKLKPYTKGTDLKKLGINPGPIYKSIYQQLISAWVDGEIISREEEADLLQSILTKSKKTN
ncbi:MAG: hypothetical protein XD73_0156 [Anaerolinea thermophila]|uniref:CBS domain-containing protein n=1 Tax=Anaerolinea thermophila TaxID=167964 RepID=A0A101FYQ4_9CHLR|nr:MAG: hypothetical protein XD73_0156 [Anaerolinea thermophila]